MKMGFLRTCYTAIVLFLTLIVVQSYGELAVLRKPPVGNAVNLTCVSEDDGAAFIWNYDHRLNDGPTVVQDSHPKKPTSATNPECAVWEADNCLAYWTTSEKWSLVKSINRPMGPVFDYRWEGFQEIVSEGGREGEKYSYVGQAEEPFRAVVFSARGKEIIIFLCTDQKQRWGTCFRFVIGSEKGTRSLILDCENKSPENGRDCRNVITGWQETPILDPFEWRTFRIEWIDEEHMIKLFKNTDTQPFLQGTIEQKRPGSHIFLSSDESSHVRFHFYQYYLTNKQNVELSTEAFKLPDKISCLELLVGLCPTCKMQIDWMDSNDRPMGAKHIFGEKTSNPNGLLTWRRIQLTPSPEQLFFPNPLKLKIRTFLDKDIVTSQWAVGTFRVCKSRDELRESTIMVRRDISSGVTCQKLSYTDSAVVNPFSKQTIQYDTTGLELLTDSLARSCHNTLTCPRLDEKWSICISTGCACNRGWWGDDCAKRCDDGSYGYSCNMKCGNCHAEYWDKKKGYCNNFKCKSDTVLPPLCKELKEPIVALITDTTAQLLQNVEPEAIDHIQSLQFQIKGAVFPYSTEYTTREGSTYKAYVQNLQPNTTYTVHSVVTAEKSHGEVKGPEIHFTTTSRGARCFKVEPNKNSLSVDWRRDIKDCGSTPLEDLSLELQNAAESHGRQVYFFPQLPLISTPLKVYTEYDLIITGNRNTISWTTKVRTLESAPGKVVRLEQTNSSPTEIFLRWSAPVQKNGIIRNYSVSLERIELRGCEKNTPAQDKISKTVKDTTAFFVNLSPYAKYIATVIAYTSEAGPESSLKFYTPETDIPTSVVSNLELVDNQSLLKWDAPEDCTTITGYAKSRKLYFSSLSDWAKEWTQNETISYNFYNLSKLHPPLAPYTSYRVRVHVARAYGNVNPDLYQEKIWTTAPAAPPAVLYFKVYDADQDSNTISIRWKPPYPSYGEIESYHVLINVGGNLLRSYTIKVLEGVTTCKLWKDYICLENCKLSSNLATEAGVKVYAKNKGISENGPSSSLKNTPEFYYQLAPGEPRDLKPNHQGQGVVTLTWLHPLFSSTRIKQFRIWVERQETYLLNKSDTLYPITVNYTVTQYQKEYSVVLALEPSAEYRFSIVSVSGRNVTSSVNEISFLIPGSLSFVSEKEPLVVFDGTAIEIKVPKVMNATKNTTIEVIVKGESICTPIQASKSPGLANPTRLETEWVAAMYQADNTPHEPFRISSEQYEGVTLKCQLNFDRTDAIVFVATDWYSKNVIELSRFPHGLVRSPPGRNLTWLIIIPIIAICVLVSVVGYRKYKKAPLTGSQQNIFQLELTRDPPSLRTISRQPREPSYVEPNPQSFTTIRANNSTTPQILESSVSQLRPAELSTEWQEASMPRQASYLEIIAPPATTTQANFSLAFRSEMDSTAQSGAGEYRTPENLYAIPNEHDSCRVSMEYFEAYAKQAAASGLLYSQFKLLPEGLTRPYKCGALPENMPKNRDRNLIAYDETRVVLKKIPGDPFSDYINASYIQGYKKERVYIATQGPMTNTINDFWRMVWQENVRVICMLTNVTEGTETKCEKYWPDVGASEKYGDYLVWTMNHQVLADYTLRTFELSHQQDIRKIAHLHYTGWPSLGVPIYPQSLVAYMKKLEETPAGNGPVVVHCSTGNGRTGTVILSDICLRRAIEEKELNVTAVISRMRESRADMVATLQQYLLAHIIISECMASLPTQITCAEVLSTRIHQLRLQLPFDKQRLEDTSWQEKALKSLGTSRSLADGQVADFPRVAHSARFGSKQVDWVSVDGVRVKKQYLAGRLPPPSNLSKFWGFVAERDIKLIIILQSSDSRNPTCCDIAIPDKSIGLPVPQVRVENKTNFDEGGYFTNETLLLTDSSEGTASTKSLTVLTCKGWGRGLNAEPPSPATLVSLWRASEKIPRKEGQTLVLCHDGITGCGLYLALSFLLERMAVERECDVIFAVRAVRRSRSEFVQSLEQFEYLYDAAVNYAQCFQIYANFC